MQFKDIILALAAAGVSFAAPTPNPGTDESDIVGGGASPQGAFPFIVSLQKSGSHFCGGSLLNANTVVTAAHCAVGQTASTLKVRAGSLNRSSGGTLVQVASIKVNTGYTSSNYDGDVAIFKLSTSIPTSSTISYATLPVSGSDPAAGTTSTVAGWGTLTEGGSTLPTTLQQVDVPIVSRTTCRADYGTSAITTNMICAGVTAGGKDSCQGDSGGPLIDTNTRVLIGLVSWGEGCAEPNLPGVYTRVGSASILSFIKANL